MRGLHIIQFPSGVYGYVGSVPSVLATPKPATRADVMGGRAFYGTDGALYTWKFPTFDKASQAVTFAQKHEVNLCTEKDCLCRKYF